MSVDINRLLSGNKIKNIVKSQYTIFLQLFVMAKVKYFSLSWIR